MNSSSQGKIALVTGGNKGIGFAICEGLLKEGFHVFLAARALDKGKAAAEKLSSYNSQVEVIQLDIADDNSIDNAFSQVNQAVSHLDVLVNNAGIYPDEGVNILTIKRDLLNHTMNTNAFGAVRVTQAFLPLLEKASAARVINVSSGYGALNGLSANVPSYCLSKLAMNGATIMLAEALRPLGIAAYVMNPGWVKTDMGGTGAPRHPEQAAETAVWLATKASIQESGQFFYDRQAVSY
jgi:NAD(P)-dependent dehydrogenase (short-subunit alcohol dehydrogenase family)